MKPQLHRSRLGERISTTRTAGHVAPSAPQRQTTIGYDSATGRIATMLANGSDVPFAWSYLPGSDLKSSLAYPNGLTASWTYDADGQLLQVRNATPTEVISQYDYTYDAAGRRIEIARSGSAMSESRTDAYGYNIRNELTSATKLGGPASVPATPEYAYQQNGCDDILSRCMKDKASEALGGWSAPVGFLGNVYKGALWLVGGIAFDFACPEKMTNDK